MRTPLLVALLFLALVPFPAASAEEPLEITIEALETGCGSGKTYCLKVTGSSLSDIVAGSEVKVTFKNMGVTGHELSVALATTRDAEHKDTPSTGALSSSDEIGGNAQTIISFTVPADATLLYFWCDVAGHEALGMWIEESLVDAEKSNPLPSLAPVAALLAIVFAAVAVGRWR